MPNGRKLALRERDAAVAGRMARWQQRFLRALAEIPSVKRACALSGINRTYAYRRRKADQRFAEKWKEALDASIDEVEARAFELALKGEDHAAAKLIMFLLSCHRPETYRERTETGVVGGIVLIPAKAKGAE